MWVIGIERVGLGCCLEFGEWFWWVCVVCYWDCLIGVDCLFVVYCVFMDDWCSLICFVLVDIVIGGDDVVIFVVVCVLCLIVEGYFCVVECYWFYDCIVVCCVVVMDVGYDDVFEFDFIIG